MIFYFSGTGNSKHVADKIANSTGDRLIFISENTIENNETYVIGENERVGFVFPVYWYSIPTIVEKFLLQLKISGYKEQYVYAVTTFGIAAGNVMNRFIRILNDKQLHLKGSFGVKMVDNYVIGYNIASEDKQRTILQNAELEIDKIISMIERRDNTKYLKRGTIAFVTPLTRYAYRKTDHTKKFYVTQDCSGCRQCERNCPCKVIHMSDGKPKWEGDCTFCLRCLHGCKLSAIQYGKFTRKRNRYQYKEL